MTELVIDDKDTSPITIQSDNVFIILKQCDDLILMNRNSWQAIKDFIDNKEAPDAK